MTDAIITTSEPTPFRGPIAGAEENPAAHGGIRYRDARSDGLVRDRNVNGSHQEVGPWRPAR